MTKICKYDDERICIIVDLCNKTCPIHTSYRISNDIKKIIDHKYCKYNDNNRMEWPCKQCFNYDKFVEK